ncbi:unnamed protein product (macronuclear) [Paramecium tetraurelia]|uniref:Uncharacterized protein n=1 Tax=Paramecium tetraurelia TaxID=5888 RepID=A0D8E9_PARTE|nr:uncharacterized protein GSPATT00014262001 [Paramecium tetraurelia]CAK79316.1 unnamed protein product [Paramecium tetraurelia]|eukprot:XP_001446713.1 hypothetical protein (macronuclear) [Paramecium tetraurelia strain d4-2]
MDLIIFLGKSISINQYLSHELEEYERYGKKFLRLKQEKDFTHDQFAKVGHSVVVSETTFIQRYKVDDMDQLMLCDCPGFADTRGDIYDLTTLSQKLN